MNYQAWNELIYKYYFGEQADTRVLFHINMQGLIDFAKIENVEIANGRTAFEFTDDFIKRDFVKKFWNNFPNGNSTIDDFESKLISLKDQCINGNDPKSLLAIVAVLIMPVCENDGLQLHGNAYYGHLQSFLYRHGFINRPVQNVGGLLNTIRLDVIWTYINEWAKSEGLPFQSSLIITENGARQYVRSLMRESLLSPSHLQKFCIIFDKAGFVPRVNIEDDRLFSAFKNYYQSVGITESKFNQLVGNEFKEYLISVLRQEYENWNGTTKVKERDRQTGKIKIESGNTYYPLLLMMNYDVNNPQATSFGLRLYCSDMDDMDDMTFIADTSTPHVFPPVYIKTDGFANRPFYLDQNEFEAIFNDRNGVYSIHEKNAQSIKGRFVVTDYYLLKVYNNKYVATNNFIKGEFYFVLIRNTANDSFNDWLEKNAAEPILDSILGGKYSLYRIENASAELPSRHNLRFKSEIKCKPANNIEVKTAEQLDVVLLSNLLPAQFEITGVDVAQDKIYAVSVNCEHRHTTELCYDSEKQLWILQVFTNHFQLQKEFKLYCNETPIPSGRIYRFADFILPQEFKDLELDVWGGTENECFSKGLTLPDEVINANLINWDTLKSHMETAPVNQIQTVEYKKKDLLLYAITSASFQTNRWIINMDMIKAIRDRIIADNNNEESRSQDRYALQNALSDYFRMGYINYTFTDKGLCLVANHPTLILLSPEYKRDITPGMNGKNLVITKCNERKYKCLLTGGRTISLIDNILKNMRRLGYDVEIKDEDNILMPQTIYIHADERSVFKTMAETMNLHYQDNIYANAMLEKLPSVDEYLQQIITWGVERDLFMVSNYRSIDYQRMAELYPNKLRDSAAISNSEIDKKSFNKKDDFVTFFPGTREETSVIINEGRMIEVNKYWGHFIGMKKMGAKVLIHDVDRAQINMPQQLRLPLLYARALTLLTGKTPESSFGTRTYSIGVNPCTYASASSPDNILRKLGQR